MLIHSLHSSIVWTHAHQGGEIAGYGLQEGLFWTTKPGSAARPPFQGAVIDQTLPVSAQALHPVSVCGYHDLTPQQRAGFLQWMSQGRQGGAGAAPLIYLSGFLRRLAHHPDWSERAVLAEETQRLEQSYKGFPGLFAISSTIQAMTGCDGLSWTWEERRSLGDRLGRHLPIMPKEMARMVRRFCAQEGRPLPLGMEYILEKEFLRRWPRGLLINAVHPWRFYVADPFGGQGIDMLPRYMKDPLQADWHIPLKIARAFVRQQQPSFEASLAKLEAAEGLLWLAQGLYGARLEDVAEGLACCLGVRVFQASPPSRPLHLLLKPQELKQAAAALQYDAACVKISQHLQHEKMTEIFPPSVLQRLHTVIGPAKGLVL